MDWIGYGRINYSGRLISCFLEGVVKRNKFEYVN